MREATGDSDSELGERREEDECSWIVAALKDCG